MSLRNSAKRIINVFDLEEGEPDYLACVAVQVKVGKGYLLPSRTAVDRDPNDVFSDSLKSATSEMLEPGGDAQ